MKRVIYTLSKKEEELINTPRRYKAAETRKFMSDLCYIHGQLRRTNDKVSMRYVEELLYKHFMRVRNLTA